ncbi:MAG: hypothetical protein IJC88_01810 [Oscillospiraceae bacterium]|nr:hypothetical protein [Oscillospiraceae bacterium]
MLHIITQFLKKQNPVYLILRFGLSYAGILAICAIVLIRSGPQFTLFYGHRIEWLLVSAITAVLQTLIGAWFLSKMEKTGSK